MELKNLYNLFAQHPEGQWIMKPPNARSLYDFVTENNIERVLDLGTGIGASAAIIALALINKGETDFHIDTVEEFDKCIKIANDIIPEELKKYITIHKSPVTTWAYDRIPYQYFSIYEAVPEGDYDLVLNDGPSPFEKNGSWVELPNATVISLLLEDKIKPGTFVAFDGRKTSIRAVERYFSSSFKLFKPTENRDFNVLKKQDVPVVFEDEQLKTYQATSTYFKGHEKNPVTVDGPPSSSEAKAVDPTTQEKL